LNIIYLPLRKDISEASIEKITDNVVYISRNKSLKELKEKLAFLYNKNLDNLELTSTNIRLWKLKPNSVSSEIKKDLLENIKEIQDQENFLKAIDFKDLFQYLECNNNFRMLDIENLDLHEVELADSDNCVVEIMTDKSPFWINIKKVEIKETNCEWCREMKKCMYYCVCKTV